jgi:hypothetical protein
MKNLLALIALTGSAIAQDYYGYSYRTEYDRPYCADPYIRTIERPYNYQREQAVPTAYSTQMQAYYDSIWREPVKPQVIIIHDLH